MKGWRPFSNYLFAIAKWHLANSTEPLEITARKLLKYYDTENEQEDEFMDDLYRILYGRMLDRDGKPHQGINKEFLRRNNKTLNAVAKLCESNRKGNSLSDVLEQLGITPIWFNEFSEIPVIISRILQS